MSVTPRMPHPAGPAPTALAITLAWALGSAALPAATPGTPILLEHHAVENLRLELAEAQSRTFEETVFALGRIRVAPGHRSFVSSRIPGRALTVSAHIDLQVERDAELVAVESRLPGDPPPVVTLRAPMAGLIAAVQVAPGQPVSPDAALVEIVDLSEVHAVAAVPEHLVGRLKLGDRARLRVAALPAREFEAELAHFGAEADIPSGTLEAAFHVTNTDLALRPGMRAEFSIVVGQRTGVLAVPREAVQGDHGDRYVFVRRDGPEHAFDRVPVVVGAENDQFMEIRKGLDPGARVVTRGAYSLSFAGRGALSLREALDAAHGHAHNDDGSEIAHENESEHPDDHDHPPGEDHDHDHDHEHSPGEDHDHGHESQWNPLTSFFASTTAVLLGLLVAATVRLRRMDRATMTATAPAAASRSEGPDA